MLHGFFYIRYQPMRTICIIVILFFATAAKAQTLADSSLNKYIKQRRYIPLKDTTHLPESVKPFYTHISAAITRQKSDIADWFIPPGGVRDEQYFIIVRLDHIQSVKARAIYLETGPKVVKDAFAGNRTVLYDARKPLAVNPSGLDREVSINKLSGIATFKIIE